MSEALEVSGLNTRLRTSAIETSLRPLRHLLSFGEDVAVNRPGEAWHYESGSWHQHLIDQLSERKCRGIATLAEAQDRPEKRQPIISTDMPSGHRGEFILPPGVAQGSVGMCFRRADEDVAPLGDIRSRYDTGRWNGWINRKERQTAKHGRLLALYDSGDLEGFMAAFAQDRMTPLFCGATGAGKTYLLKTYLTLLPIEARILVLEDAREAVLHQLNHLRLIFKKGGIRPLQLLATSLRLRPDFVALQELKDPEAAWVYLNECMAGHPGSPTTVHGATAADAARRLFNMIKGSPDGQSIEDGTLKRMLSGAIDMIVPIENAKGARSIGEIWFAHDAARRGESFVDLIEDA